MWSTQPGEYGLWTNHARCEGLPDGPCPRKINNRSDKLSHAHDELMLCKSCRNVRFPPTVTSEADSKSVANSTVTSVSATCVLMKDSVTRRQLSCVNSDKSSDDDDVITARMLFLTVSYKCSAIYAV